MGCARLCLPEIAALANSWGIEQVELRSVSGRLDLPACFAAQGWLKGSPTQVLGGMPVRIVNFSSSITLTTDFADAAAEMAAYAPLMAHYDTPWLRVFDGKLSLPADIERIWRWLDDWEQLRTANNWRFNLLLETHDSLLTPDAIATAFAKDHPHVKLLWDPHNIWKHTGATPLENWQALRQWTRLIHIKDSVSVPDTRHPYSYTLPGKGEFPLQALLTQLEQDSFDGPVSLEWERLWHPQMDPIERALASLADIAEQAHLKATASGSKP